MFKLSLVTPEKKLVTDQEMEEIIVPANAGELNILPGHAPLLTTLIPGILKYKLKGTAQFFEVAISWGYCQVSAEGVNVLAEHAMTADEIKPDLVKKQLKDSEARLASESLDNVDWESAQHEIARLKAELDLVEPTKLH